MRLCLAAGRLDVDRALDELTPEQMNEWIEFLELEPGSLNLARQNATIVGTIAATHGVEIDEDKLLSAWGFAANEPPPQTQDEANRRLKAAWG